MARKQCFLVCPPSGNTARKQFFLVCQPSGNMARKQCFLVCPPSGNMARKQYFLVCLPSGNMTRKQCFLVCPPSGNMARKQCSWFVCLQETCPSYSPSRKQGLDDVTITCINDLLFQLFQLSCSKLTLAFINFHQHCSLRSVQINATFLKMIRVTEVKITMVSSFAE